MFRAEALFGYVSLSAYHKMFYSTASEQQSTFNLIRFIGSL